MAQPMQLVIFGRQGSGKGTQCGRLVKALGVVHLSTGDILRHNVSNETELGKKVKPLLESGQLVDDATISELVADRLTHDDVVESGFILDGFPRTVPQAEGLLEMMGDRTIDVAINLDVELDVVMARILDRGRNDDVADSIKQRLALYEAETVPVIDLFAKRGSLVTVDGVGEEAEITLRVIDAINGHKSAV